ANGLLFSRELIRDSNGNPAAFPISSDEQLQVTYELRLYPNLADVPATVTVGASSYDTITRPIAVAGGWGAVTGLNVNAARDGTTPGVQRAYTGDLIPYTSTNPSGNLGDASSGATASYTNGSY